MDGLIVVLTAGDGNVLKRKPMKCANVIVLDATIGSRKVTSRGESVKSFIVLCNVGVVITIIRGATVVFAETRCIQVEYILRMVLHLVPNVRSSRVVKEDRFQRVTDVARDEVAAN